MDDPMEVGLIDSTRRMGKPFTWGSDQQECDSLKLCGKTHSGLRIENIGTMKCTQINSN